jgi:hypothetical protein
VNSNGACHTPALRNMGPRIRTTGFATGIGAFHAQMARAVCKYFVAPHFVAPHFSMQVGLR